MKKLILALLLSSAASNARAVLPIGYNDTATCSTIAGWSCDQDTWSNMEGDARFVSVEIYVDPVFNAQGAFVGGTWLNTIKAANQRSDIAYQCGNHEYHGFSYNPGSDLTKDGNGLTAQSKWNAIKDGRSHTILAVALDYPPNSTTLRRTALPGWQNNQKVYSLSVNCLLAPQITTQPSDKTVLIGQAATFTAAASGTAPMNFQWLKNGANIPGANSPTYTTPAALASDNGTRFSVVVSNSSGTVASRDAVLSVQSQPGDFAPDGRLESADCSVFTGWACDQDNYNQSIQVQFYADGAIGAGTLIGTALAGGTRAGAAFECSGIPNHGFSFPTPALLKNGQPRKIYAYAVNIGSSANPLLQSTRTITCVDPNNQPPTGVVVVSTSGGVSGWARDPDTAQKVTVRFFVDGSSTTGILAGSALANLPIDPNASSFLFSIPNQFRDNILHTLNAYAGDLGGGPDALLPGSPQTFTLTVAAPDTTPPSVSIQSPSSGAFVSGIVQIAASASDNIGVTKVEFYVDGALLAADASAPFQAVWSSTAAVDGPHALSAKAYDAAGNSAQALAPVVAQNGMTRSWWVIPSFSNDLTHPLLGAQLSISSNALPGSAPVLVTIAAEDRSDMGLESLKDASANALGLTRAGDGVELSPEGVSFLRPVSLSLPVLPCDGTEASIYYWNETVNAWEKSAGAAFDPLACAASARLDHFSTYAVFFGPSAGGSTGAGGLGEVYVFPNPAQDGKRPVFHIETGSAGARLRVYNVAGELVHTMTLDYPPSSLLRAGVSSTGYEYAWEYGGNGSGVYFYVVEGKDGGKAKGKFVIVR